jgi:hypothetical protein
MDAYLSSALEQLVTHHLQHHISVPFTTRCAYGRYQVFAHEEHVVDPGQTTRNCNPGDYFRARVIIVTSPNAVHWGGSSFLKPRDDNIVMLSGGTFFYYPIWSWAELLQAREYLNANSKVKLSLEEMRVRYMNVGGVPRHLWAQEKLFEPVKQTQALAVNKLSPIQAEQITMGEW